MARRNRRTTSECARIAILLNLCLLLLPITTTAQERVNLEGLREMLNTGKYDECINAASAQIGKVYGEGYYTAKVKAELARGKYADATKTVEAGINKYSWSIALRWQGYEAYLHADNTARAADMIKEIDQLFERQSWRFTDAEDLVVLGNVALLVGADPRIVLENFFDRAKKNGPNEPDGYIAAGEMALDKNDKRLAADLFNAAAKKFPTNVEVLFGLARSLTDSNAARSGELFDQILKQNPKHVPTILLQTDRLISSEQFESAEKNIGIALNVNGKSPKAWALRAVISHLKSNYKREASCREKALATWKNNPAVDHWIGAKLSRAYRFKEGSAYQRRSLELDPNYVPAKTQLSQDLLRLGLDEEGWKLAEAAHEADGYDTTTFNLLNLRDHMAKFRTIENDHFIVRMSEQEAGIYGARVIALLERARAKLTEKYGIELRDKTTVEIFPEENDFAVRTFGMPAVSGFLGVCFGNLITANSPASQLDSPNNWEAVLWHEFCHVITLSKTRNKMPRWLSEGISVYEEMQENPIWGMEMLPQYREWILEGEMQKVGSLSKAFINAPSPLHVQFAYFQSYLVVDYIAETHGVEVIREILDDLGNGVLINEALNRRTNSLAELEEGFVKFAQKKANDLAPEVDWTAPETEILRDPAQLASFVEDNPNNYIGLKSGVAMLVRAKRWDEAEETLKHLVEIYPQDVSRSNARETLAVIYRERGDTAAEQQVLEEYVAIAADAADSYARLIELYSEQENNAGVLAMTDKLFAVNPLMKSPWKLRASAAEELGQPEKAIEAYRSLISLGPEDPALVHYRLAKLLHAKGDANAKRHVLMALEEAPRYRDAHRLLLQVIEGRTEDDSTSTELAPDDEEAKLDPEKLEQSPRTRK
ncbi:MAG: tetratricopeptide repeat protein [Planctomycetaceae bacterium]